jgi:hypothetical protein
VRLGQKSGTYGQHKSTDIRIFIIFLFTLLAHSCRKKVVFNILKLYSTVNIYQHQPGSEKKTDFPNNDNADPFIFKKP